MGLAVQVSVSMRKQGYNSSRSQFSCSQQMAIQMQWFLTETLVHRRKEFLLMESISGASVAVWFHVVALTFTNTATYVGSKKQTKKSSVTVNVTLKCINRRDDCRTHQVLLPFCIILTRPQLGTRCVLLLHREIQERHGSKWEPPEGNSMNQQSLTQSELGGQARRNGVFILGNVISDMRNLHASKRLCQEQEEQMFSLSLLGRMRSTCKLW